MAGFLGGGAIGTLGKVVLRTGLYHGFLIYGLKM